MNVYQVELSVTDLKTRNSCIMLIIVNAKSEAQACELGLDQGEEFVDYKHDLQVNGCTYLYPCETIN